MLVLAADPLQFILTDFKPKRRIWLPPGLPVPPLQVHNQVQATFRGKGYCQIDPKVSPSEKSPIYGSLSNSLLIQPDFMFEYCYLPHLSM
jgi:hypothetical protein